mgnify:CR=1 FL=1
MKWADRIKDKKRLYCFRMGITIASFHEEGKVEDSRMRLRREVYLSELSRRF